MSENWISRQIANELKVREPQVGAVLKLLEEGATIPFIARYRKEATGGLDDTQLRTLEERLQYLRDLDKRRETILQSIEEQGKLTPDLRQCILNADSKARLEDLYLPYKIKRRTKAFIAREAGLTPLADTLFEHPDQHPQQAALPFVNPEKGIADTAAALDGAAQILIEDFSESSELIGSLRQFLWNTGVVISTVVKAKKEEAIKFSDYFDYVEPIRAIPSHRALALFRGKNEGFLRVSLRPAADKTDLKNATDNIIARITRHFNWQHQNLPADDWLASCFHDAWSDKILPHLENDLMTQLRERAEAEAIQVFARNLRDLLLAAPAGPQVTLGLDPGLRTGVKTIVVDATGKILTATVIYPHVPQNEWDKSIEKLAELIQKFSVSLVSIGNGTGSRETDRLVGAVMKKYPALGITKVMVSEAGASVYSASASAAQEMPDLDVSLRGAVSIARRLQDPLAELVKIEPKAIGVGQYQHDVNQSHLERSLDAVVQDCVNAVGVDVNTASPALLRYVAGLSPSLAKAVVETRDKNGPFSNREALKKVPRLGPKAFEQAAGFLRVMDGNNPLDASAVHPEAYPLVEKIMRQSGREIHRIIGDHSFLSSLKAADFTDERFGLPTVKDILLELEKPGRDPRPDFKTATFQEGVESLKDLQPDMRLEGVVTNVTNFGAFVDIGVHQDGLVHISMLADRFVKDPHSVVKAGDIVQVKVVEVDIPRKRIALSMRQDG
jgi:uncharacterized protein